MTPAFHAGQIVAGRYLVLRYLNHGGMGEVYEVRDLDLGLPETIALKTLLPAIAEDESMINLFKREIALSRKVAHPNVCKIFDFARHEIEGGRSVVFLSMEYLGGETLGARLKRVGAMSPAEALPLLLQMAAALDASHAAGVIHRDFKPSNVMLVPEGDRLRVVVTDFGLAHRFVPPDGATATMSKVIAGTVDYMAPELFTGNPATFASDIYALGMVAYRMITGSLPFSAPTPMAGAMLRSHRTVPSPRTLVPGLDDMWERSIMRALDADPSKRYSTAGDFLLALQGDPVAAGPKPPVITRRRVAIATAGLVLAGAAAGWLKWTNANRPLQPEVQALYQKGVVDNAAGAYFAATQALEEAAKLAPGAPQVRAKLAEAWVGLDMPEKAAEDILLVRRLNSSRLSRTDRLQIEAIDLSITREFAAAAAKYEELARLVPENADVAFDLGRAYENADRPDDAIRTYRRAAEGSEHNPAAWLRLGVLYARQANYGKSSDAFAQAEHLYQLTSNLEGLTEVSLQRGIAANASGQLDLGAVFLKKSLANARIAGNLQEEINATLRLSTNAYLSGASAEADSYAREALDTARKHHLDGLAIRGLINLGNAFRRKQDYAGSEQYYRDALDLANQAHSSHLAALSLLSLAGLHDETHQGAEAVREAQEALKFYQANRYAKESLQCETVIARAKRDSGDYDGALASFRTLLQMAESSQDRAQLALAHEGIGTMLFRQDRYPEALEHYRKSLEFATDREHVGYASLDCGNTLWRLGQYQEAADAFDRAAANALGFSRLKLQLMCGRAAMSLSRNRFPEAADMARGALAAGIAPAPDLHDELDQVLGLALLRTGNKSEGARRCEAARSAIEARHDASQIPDAALALLETRIEQREKKSALQLLREMEPLFATRPELRWRALALSSRADAQYTGPAREALQKLARLWGDSAYNTYLTRPDIVKLSRSVLHSISAVH